MDDALRFDRPGPHEEGPLAQLMASAFGLPVESMPDWWRVAGLEQLRVLAHEDRVLGGLIVLPKGQFIAGQRVPMVGYAGVVVAPEQRGRGLGRELMRRSLREQRAEDHVISTLYASNLALYRSAGFEVAGIHFTTRVATRALPRGGTHQIRGLLAQRLMIGHNGQTHGRPCSVDSGLAR